MQTKRSRNSKRTLNARLCAFVVINMDVETEYTPEGEIEEEEFRKTLVTLYFKNKDIRSKFIKKKNHKIIFIIPAIKEEIIVF